MIYLTLLTTLIISLIIIISLINYEFKKEKKKLSKRQYLLLGLVCVGFWLYVAVQVYAMDNSAILLSFTFLSMIIITALIDLYTYYIFDSILILFSVVHLFYSYFKQDLIQSLYGLVTGFIFYGIIYLIAKLIYKREAFGLGDVFFLSAIGIVVGPIDTFLIGILSFYVAAIFLIFNSLIFRRLNIKSELPFGPYIAIASLLIYFHSDKLIELYISFTTLINHLFNF